MWENLNVYKQLDKKDIYRTFKQLGVNFISLIDGYLNYPATAITRNEYLKPDGGKYTNRHCLPAYDRLH